MPTTANPVSIDNHHFEGDGSICDSVTFYQHDVGRIEAEHWRYPRADDRERLAANVHVYGGMAKARIGQVPGREYVAIHLGETDSRLAVLNLYVPLEQAQALRDALTQALQA